MTRKQATVDEFMEQLDYPLKAEVEALRAMIKAVSPHITEEIKWNAPSFSYKGYLATFNFHDRKQIRLVFHNPAVVGIQSEILEGDYPDRRLVYFSDMNDVNAKQAALTHVIRTLVAGMDA